MAAGAMAAASTLGIFVAASRGAGKTAWRGPQLRADELGRLAVSAFFPPAHAAHQIGRQRRRRSPAPQRDLAGAVHPSVLRGDRPGVELSSLAAPGPAGLDL